MQYSLLTIALLPLLNPAPALARSVPRQAANLQSFTGALGGLAATPVTNSGNSQRPFEVSGDTFVNFSAAQQRSCDQQFNACADAANSGAAFSVSDCQTQETQCLADNAENTSGSASTGTSSSSSSAAAVAPAATSSTAAAAVVNTCPGVASAAPASSSTASTTSTTSTNSALDLGSCSNPTIVFGPGFDGRNQDSFEPANKADFNHGSALNIGVISSFICGQLQSACKASEQAQAACASGQAAAATVTGQAAANAFNAAFA